MEVAAIPPELAAEFSRRNRQILAEGGTEQTSAQRRLVAAQTREAKQDIEATDVLAAWKDNAEAVLNDGQGRGGAQRLADILAAAMPGPPPAGTGLDLPDPQQIAAVVFDPDTGLTAGTKAFDRAQALAEVAAALPPGLLVPGELEALTDAVLRAEGYPVALRDLHASHHSNTDRYTTADVLEAEETIRTQARVRIGEQLRAAVEAAAVEQGLAGHELRAGIAYSAQQRAVLERILTGQCGVDAVEGLAGAGKTVIFAGANAVWKEHGKTVAGAAMYAVAAQNLQAESGIESATVARWLQRIREGEGLDGVDVLVVDEAALVDDRALAVLLAQAWTTGTQVVLVGDHQQLKPIGIGGGFAEVHRIVKGLSLTENRRQVDAKERATLEKWRLGDRAEALRDLAANGRVHATDTAEQSAEAMLAAWDRQRGQWSDPHEQLRSLLLLAARNRDVDVLNQGARAIRRATANSPTMSPSPWPTAAAWTWRSGTWCGCGSTTTRARRGVGEVDVLNGYRGVVLQADSRRGVLVEWQRTSGPGRTVTEAAWFTPQQLQQGAVSHAYAMTIALAQGLTCQRALVAGVGADSYTLYPALTRARLGTDLWLPLESLEEPEVRARLGAPEDDQVRLARRSRPTASGWTPTGRT
ncbi:AAA family ATPase [Streptacidiphilus sp. 4-A2]|nr:AAA family ATPase [Streptacidiphilus sp. 4-A2]